MFRVCNSRGACCYIGICHSVAGCVAGCVAGFGWQFVPEWCYVLWPVERFASGGGG